MSEELRDLRRDLRPITNTFTAGRLIILLLFCLFMIPMILGFLVEVFQPRKEAVPPAPTTHDRRPR